MDVRFKNLDLHINVDWTGLVDDWVEGCSDLTNAHAGKLDMLVRGKFVV